MKVEQVICDECSRQKGEANHWLKVGVLELEFDDGVVVLQLTLGVVPDKEMPGYEVHDICGQACFHKHIDKLLGLSGDKPASIPPPLPMSDGIEWHGQVVPEYTGI